MSLVWGEGTDCSLRPPHPPSFPETSPGRDPENPRTERLQALSMRGSPQCVTVTGIRAIHVRNDKWCRGWGPRQGLPRGRGGGCWGLRWQDHVLFPPS